MAETAQQPKLLGLPAELVQHIIAFLEPVELARVAQACKPLATHAYDDQIWQPLINRNLPDPITEPKPFNTFRELYIAHHPYWFLTKHQFWFGDGEHQGKLVLARYDPRRACVEAYTVAAQRGPHTLEFWEKDREVIIHSFSPRIKLDLNRPVLKLDVDSLRTNDQPDNEPSDRGYAPLSQYSKEILMENFAESGLFSSFMLCRALPEKAISDGTAVWPPLRLPTPTRVRNDTRDGYQSSGHRPTTLDEVSQHHFRLRKWVEYTGRRASPSLMSWTSPNGLSAALGFNGPYFAAGMSSSQGGGMSIRMPEDITTFATLPDYCFRPTTEKPWQGLWCGDYSGHGCEFLVILQPDKNDERPLPTGMDWLKHWFRGGRRGSSSSGSSYASAQEEIDYAEAAQQQLDRITQAESGTQDAEQDLQAQAAQLAAQQVLEGFTETPPPAQSSHQAQHRQDAIAESEQQYDPAINDVPDAPTGRLEAIKLTGDPNIPRGEYTFVAPDIGHGGFMRLADEEIFRGARIVRSAGHIAGRGFREHQYTPSQLIMIDHNRLAQFWEGFGHISFYQRVDVEALMKYKA